MMEPKHEWTAVFNSGDKQTMWVAETADGGVALDGGHVYGERKLLCCEILRLAARVKKLEAAEREQEGYPGIAADFEECRRENLRLVARAESAEEALMQATAKAQQLRSQRDEEKRRADEAENRVLELMREMQLWKSRNAEFHYEGEARVDAAVKPYRDEVRHLTALLDVRDGEVGRLRGEVAILEDRLGQLQRVADRDAYELGAARDHIRTLEDRLWPKAIPGHDGTDQDRIDELEQENHRLRDGIGRTLCLLLPHQESVTAAGLGVKAAIPVLQAAREGQSEPVTREKLEEMSERVREIKGGLAPDPEPRVILPRLFAGTEEG